MALEPLKDGIRSEVRIDFYGNVHKRLRGTDADKRYATEVAVLKVLGFRPGQIMVLVLGEALLIGIVSGIVSAGGSWFVVNQLAGGIPFPIAFFPKFMIPADAWWWGLAVGGGTAFLGSFIPSWTACRVKVSEVFARVG